MLSTLIQPVLVTGFKQPLQINDLITSVHAMYQNIFSFKILGDLVSYTFLDTFGPTESEKQFLLYSKHCMAAILDFQNGDFFLKSAISRLLSIIDTWFRYLNIHYQGQLFQWDDV